MVLTGNEPAVMEREGSVSISSPPPMAPAATTASSIEGPSDRASSLLASCSEAACSCGIARSTSSGAARSPQSNCSIAAGGEGTKCGSSGERWVLASNARESSLYESCGES